MQISLSAELEKYVESKIGSGGFLDAAEVIGNAVRQMRENEVQLAPLRDAVLVGDEPLGRGEGKAYAPERLERITERAIANASAGKPEPPRESRRLFGLSHPARRDSVSC